MLAMATSSSSAPARDLRALSKGHLHVHLEGAMRPTTLAELADVAGIPVPEIRGYGSFSAFSETYVASCQVLLPLPSAIAIAERLGLVLSVVRGDGSSK